MPATPQSLVADSFLQTYGGTFGTPLNMAQAAAVVETQKKAESDAKLQAAWPSIMEAIKNKSPEEQFAALAPGLGVEVAAKVVKNLNPQPKLVTGTDAMGNPILIDKATGQYTLATMAGTAPAGGMGEPPLGDGLPPPAGGRNPKLISEVQKGVTTDEFKDLNEAAAGARKRLSLLDQAESSLSGLDTGAFANERGFAANLPVVGDVFGGKEFATKVQGAEAAIKPIAKTFRTAGEGATSDRDISLLMKSSPSVENQPEANRAIIAAQREQAKRDIDYSNTVQDLFNRGYTLPQAKQLYQEYVNANPIFGGDSLESGINPNKVDSFAEWLSAGKPDNSAAGGKDNASPDIESGITAQFPDATRGADGNWYVKKDGKTYMVRPK